VITQIAVAVVLFVLVVLYVSWTAGRLDRLHARVDAAWATLDAALVRRASAARAVAAALPALENDLSRALRGALHVLPPGEDLTELEQASSRVGLARAFHNAAVRDTLVVRLRRIPRALRLAGHRDLPQYFEIDDTTVPH
jgi:hypothetical protein